MTTAPLKIFHRSSHEAQDELEAALSQSYSAFQSQLSSPFHISTATPNQRPPLTQALLFAILVHQPQSSTPPLPPTHLIDHLTTITTDGYASLVALLLRLVNDSYPKLLDQPRAQLIWIFKQLIVFNAADVDALFLALLRQIVGADSSANNIWLATQLLEILNTNLSWVIGNAGLLTGALYTYLRLLADHSINSKNSAVLELRQAEIKFCCSMLRDHFQECMGIGRDLVRLLQDVSSVSEFEGIWSDLIYNPASFRTPSFTDFAQLYVVRTPTRYFQSRLTPDMESQVKFMLTHVRMGNQRRYQSWFSQRFLSSPENETLVCDVIRYICCVHHPSNQILQSDILPRWALIGWLLKCCKSNHVEGNAKLALFYDWLFFGAKTDNIMNIEPGILVMVHSIPKYADMTNALLDFLFMLMENYDPARKELLQRSVAASFDILVGKGVVRSLELLTTSSLVAPSLREKLAQFCPTHCKVEGVVLPKAFHGKSSVGREESAADGGQGSEERGELAHQDVGGGGNVSEHPGRKRRRTSGGGGAQDELQSQLDKFAKALASSQDAAIKVLEGSLGCLTSLERAEKFASQITEITSKGGVYKLFTGLTSAPTNKPEGDETMSITSTLFRLYVGSCFPPMRSMLIYWHREGSPVGARLLCYISRLAEELESKDHVVGILNSKEAAGEISDVSDEDGEAPPSPAAATPLDQQQMKPGINSSSKRLQRLGSSSLRQKNLQQACFTAVADAFKAYEEFLKATISGGDADQLRKALLLDLNACLVWNVSRLQRVLPSVFRYLSNLAVGCEELLQLMLSVVAPAEALNLELKLALGEFAVIGSQENAAKLIKASLKWDCQEQYYFWRLLSAEIQSCCGPVTSVEIVKLSTGFLNPEADFEAVSGLLSLLRSSPPSAALSSALLSSPGSLAKLVAAVFSSWFFAFFGALISSLKQLSEAGNDPGGGGGGVKKLNWLTLDALLSHFDDLDVARNLQALRKKQAVEIRQVLLRLAANHEDCSAETS